MDDDERMYWLEFDDPSLDDHGPGDSFDGPDRDEYAPGGLYFD